MTVEATAAGSAAAPEDAAILRHLSRDRDRGFEQLVRCYQPVVYSVALRVCGNGQAEDLAAECFLRAFRALRSYDDERVATLQPRAWLLTILLNTWRNSLRDAARRPAETSMAELPDRVSQRPSVEELVQADETRRELGQLLAALPADQRSAIVLRHVVDLPVAEVATIMNCAEGTVRSHVSRGMSRLRQLQPELATRGPREAR